MGACTFVTFRDDLTPPGLVLLLADVLVEQAIWRERAGSDHTPLPTQAENAAVMGTVHSLDGLATSHSFVYELFAGVKISLEHESVVQVSEHGVLQSDPSLLLERLEGLCVVMLSEVFEAKADGFLFSVLEREDGVIRVTRIL